MQKIENIINHIVLVLDASLSMTMVSDQLIKVADNQIKYLANRSKELDQETRITVYTFASQGGYYSTTPDIRCLVYDKDVLRMPSIASMYSANGNTPLIDATLLALEDLAMTPEKYGEHSFLVYVLTDGEENASKNRPAALTAKINSLPDNWTVATFVPSQTGVFEAKKFGFPKDNIAVWDTTDKGVQEVGEVMRQATENFMVSRSQGVRSIKNLFTMDTPSLSQIDAHMQALHYGQFYLYDVKEVGRIDEFVQKTANRPYKVGEAYYELSKPETIQAQKAIAILGKSGLYVGPDARKLLNLPAAHVKVAPKHNADYKIFVQSTSVNRKLMPNTQLLIIP
jgi:hypothetical protein